MLESLRRILKKILIGIIGVSVSTLLIVSCGHVIIEADQRYQQYKLEQYQIKLKEELEIWNRLAPIKEKIKGN